jgi:hypothetical protein
MDKPFLLQLIFIPFVLLCLYILYSFVKQDIKKKRPIIELDLRRLFKKKLDNTKDDILSKVQPTQKNFKQKK